MYEYMAINGLSQEYCVCAFLERIFRRCREWNKKKEKKKTETGEESIRVEEWKDQRTTREKITRVF